MALFRESPEKTSIKHRDAALANYDRLTVRLHEAEANVIAAKSGAQRAAMDGDDGALDVAEAAEAAAQRRLGTIVAAHAEAGKLLALLETQIAEITDKKLRVATAAEVVALADELAQAGAGFDASTALLAEVAGRAVAVTFEATGLNVFSASARVEVGAATEVVAQVLREHGRAVLNGLAPAAMPKPAPPAAHPVAVVTEPLVRVFATRAVKWRDADGAERAAGKYVDVDLPAATAKRALSCGAALDLSNPARKQNLGQWPGNYSLAQCHDLDAVGPKADAATPQHDPIKHGAFEERIGKPFTLKIAAGRT